MAADQDVGGIALGLSLDTSGWSSGIAKAKAELEGLKRSAGNIEIGVTSNVRGQRGGGGGGVTGGPAVVAGIQGAAAVGQAAPVISPRFQVSAGSVRQLRTEINAQLRSLNAAGEAVAIPIKLGRVPYATFRSEIATGIGEVPIRIKPDAGSLTAFAAVLSAMTGQTPGRARASIQSAAASRGIPARAQGGPASANRPYLVGERGPEIHWPSSSGTYMAPQRAIGGPVYAKAGAIAERLSKRESDFLGNLRQASQELRPEHVRFGKEWYGNARQWVAGQSAKYGIPEDVARGVTAALSAGTQWGANKTKAERVFAAYASGRPFPYSPSLNAHVEAENIIYGRKGPVPSGPKVSQFYRNLAGDFSALTLDRWALRTATQGKISQIGKGPVRDKIVGAYMQAAAEMGMDPAEYQAAVWGLEKERAGARAGGGKDLARYMAGGGRVAPFCATCGTNIQNPRTHQSTAKHQANARGRSSGRGLSSAPPWAFGYRNQDAQYDPPGFEPDTEWWGKRYRGGPAFTGPKGVFPGGVDLRKYPRAQRLEAGKELYRLGRAYPYTASRMTGIQAITDERMRLYLLRAEGMKIGPKEVGGVTDDEGRRKSKTVLGYRSEGPYMALNASMNEQDIKDLGAVPQNLPEMVAHEFGHAVDYAHGMPSLQTSKALGMLKKLPDPSIYGSIGIGGPQEKFAELFAVNTRMGYSTDLHSLFDPIRQGDNELYSQLLQRGRAKGGMAQALRDTIAHGGGTFGPRGKAPYGRYAVSTGMGTSHLVDPNDPRSFMRGFKELTETSPYVGTWLHEGQIHIDPVTVRRHKRDAMRIGRMNEQLAIYDLKRNRELPVRAGGGDVWPMRTNPEGLHPPDPGGIDVGRDGRPLGGRPRGRASDDVRGFTMKRGREWDADDVKAWENQLRETSRGPKFPTGMGGFDPIDPRWLPKLKRAAGGLADMGKYIIGEIGRELFVPKTNEGMIPPDVAAQIPGAGGLLGRILSGKARRGGGIARDIGGRGSEPWNAPEDGWIIPNKLMSRMPRHRGGAVHPHPHPSASGKTWIDETGQQIPASRIGEAMINANARRAAGARNVNTAGGTGQFLPPTPPILGQADDALNQILPGLNEASSFRPRGGFDAEAVREAERTRAFAGATRGLTGRAALGGVFGFFGGGRQRREAGAEARIAQRQLQSFLPRGVEGEPAEVFTQKLIESQDILKGLTGTLEELNKQGLSTTPTYKATAAAAKVAEGNVKAFSKTLGEIGEVEQRQQAALLKAQGGAASNLLAVTASGFAFNVGMQALQVGLEGAKEVLTPIVDQLFDFSAINQRTTKTLGDMLPQVGNLPTVLAQTGMQAGLGARQLAFFEDTLGDSIFAKAGGAAAGRAGELFRSSISGAPTGLIGGFGGIGGGAIGAGLLGGQKGVLEEIAGTNAALRGQPQAAGVGGDFEQGLGVLGRVLNNGADQLAAIWDPARAREITDPFQQVITQTPEMLAAQKEYLQYVDDAIGRGRTARGERGGGAQLADVGIGSAAAARVLQIPGIDDYTKQLAESGVVFKDATGNLITSTKGIEDAVSDFARGAAIPTPEAFAKAQAQQLRAAQQQAAARGELERETLIPGQLGQQVVANPFISAQAGIQRGFQPTIASLTRIQSLQEQVTRDAEAGVEAQATLIDQQLGTGQGAQFRTYMGDVAAYGQEIASLNEQLANRQAQLGAAQYAFQLRIINRQIRDARGLAGMPGGSQLGQLQREQFMLGRESQRLQLESQRLANELAQRQINFQIAVAGFQAPGITGQERAARMEEARVEAAFAQRQLDIGKQQTGIAGQQFGVEGQIFTLQTQIAVQELEAQRGLLVQSHAIEQEQIAVNKQIAALTVRQAQVQAKAQSLFAEATGSFDARLGAASQYVAQFGGTLAAALVAVRRAIDVLSGRSQTGAQRSRTNVRGAQGLLGFTGGETNLTVGEVAGEAVAILKNPRQLSLGGPAGMPGVGGGTTQVNVTITGNNISNDMDLETIVRKVTSAVEDGLGRKANLLGVGAV